MDEADIELARRLQAGDQEAAAEVFQRYTTRLIALARSRLSGKLARRVDPEDVVQSAYRSFFAGVSEGEFRLGVEGELWGLLVAITLHKVSHQVAHHRAKKRDAGCEEGFSSEQSLFGLQPNALAREPSPVEALALVEQVEHVMRELSPLQRQVLELRLSGHNLADIATRTGRSLRTVCRAIDAIKQLLEQKRGREYDL